MKGTIFIIIAAGFLFNCNCQEIRNLSVTLDKPYEISCDIKGLKHTKVCWVTTSSEENLPSFPPGITLDDGRISSFGDAQFCGARVERARKSDEGTWRCNYAVQNPRSTDIEVLETRIVVQDPAYSSESQDAVPEISKVQVAVKDLALISKSPDPMLEISKNQVSTEHSAFIAKSKDTMPDIPEIPFAAEDKSSNIRSPNLIPRSRKEVKSFNPFIRTL